MPRRPALWLATLPALAVLSGCTVPSIGELAVTRAADGPCWKE